MSDVIKSDGWEDPALLDAVTKDLEAFNKEDEGGEPTPEPADNTPAADAESTSTPEGEAKEEPTPATDKTEEAEATPADDGKEPAGDENPAIPDGHYRAAIHMGMTPEEVSALYDADPKLALKTVAKCYEMTNAASKQLGELGQAMRKAKETPAAPVGESRREKAIKAIKEKYADDPMVDVLIELLPEETPAARQPTVSRPETPAPVGRSVDEEIAVRQQISTFFADPDLEAYEDFYGPAKGPDGSAVGTWGHLTPGQQANRLAMLERAQLILDGAEATGLKLGAAEAMERAHLEVSAPIAATIVREKIKASVVKRAKGVTLKPSAGKTPPPKGGQYDEQKHVAEVAAELKAVFGK